MLFISHDLSVVRVLCDTVAVMNAGKIVEMASADQLFRNPQQEYTKHLISDTPSLETATGEVPAGALPTEGSTA